MLYYNNIVIRAQVTLLEPRPDGARLTESDELCEEYM